MKSVSVTFRGDESRPSVSSAASSFCRSSPQLIGVLVCFQSKEYKTQNEQLQQVNVTLGSEVNKLQKQLEQVRSQQGDGGQLTSLQEELERLREALQEATAQRKKLEEEHSTEKLDLQQVRRPEVCFHQL